MPVPVPEPEEEEEKEEDKTLLRGEQFHDYRKNDETANETVEARFGMSRKRDNYLFNVCRSLYNFRGNYSRAETIQGRKL